MAIVSEASGSGAPLSRTQAETALSAVSMARIFIRRLQRLGLSFGDLLGKPLTDFGDHALCRSMLLSKNRCPPADQSEGELFRDHALDLLDRVDDRHVMAQQILDSVPQGRGRRRAARARALHSEIDHPLAIAAELDVAAVAGHRGPHARLDQLLD